MDYAEYLESHISRLVTDLDIHKSYCHKVSDCYTCISITGTLSTARQELADYREAVRNHGRQAQG